MVFKDITTVDLQLQMQVREWRNHIDIRKNMYTDNIITEQEHEAWIESLLSINLQKSLLLIIKMMRLVLCYLPISILYIRVLIGLFI